MWQTTGTPKRFTDHYEALPNHCALLCCAVLYFIVMETNDLQSPAMAVAMRLGISMVVNLDGISFGVQVISPFAWCSSPYAEDLRS